MNMLRTKSFLGFFLSLMIFCIPLFAHKNSIKKESNIQLTFKSMGRLLLCGLDFIGLCGTYYISTEGYKNKEYINIVGSFLILGIPSWRCLKKDLEEYKKLGKIAKK